MPSLNRNNKRLSENTVTVSTVDANNASSNSVRIAFRSFRCEMKFRICLRLDCCVEISASAFSSFDLMMSYSLKHFVSSALYSSRLIAVCAYIDSGTLTMYSGEIYGNNAKRDGGGVYLFNSTMTMSGYSEIYENTAGRTGGGVYRNNSTLTVTPPASVHDNTPNDIV